MVEREKLVKSLSIASHCSLAPTTFYCHPSHGGHIMTPSRRAADHDDEMMMNDESDSLFLQHL